MAFKSLAIQHYHFERQFRIAAQGFTLFLLAFFCLLQNAQAQNKTLSPLVLTDTTREVFLAPNSFLQIDENNEITPQSIEQSQGRNLNGKTIAGTRVAIGTKAQNAWIVTRVKNIGSEREWMVDIGQAYDGRMGIIKSARAYAITLPDSQGIPFSISPLKASTDGSVFFLSMPKNQQKLLLINIQTAGKINTLLPLKIFAPNSYLKHVKERSAHNSILMFLMGVFAAIFAGIFLAKRRLGCAACAIYFGTCAYFYALGNAFFEPTASYADPYLLFAAPFVISLLSILLSRGLLGANSRNDTSRFIYITLVLLNLCCAFLFFLAPSEKSYHIYLLSIAPFVTFLSLGVHSALINLPLGWCRQGISMGYAFMGTGFFLSILPYFDLYTTPKAFLSAFWYALPLQSALILYELMIRRTDVTYNKTNISGLDDSNIFSGKVREAKDTADHSRLLKIIEKEREALAEFRRKESLRMKEMERAKEAADEANREKSAFLAVVSHEIRTPMTGIMGMVKLLLGTSLNKQQHDYALTVQESAEAMMSLLNDILDFEKIQRGKIEIEHISFDLHRIIHGVINLMSGHAAEKKIALLANMDEGVPRFVKGDPTRLRQVLLNLMGNAIKFTNNGSVTLYVKNLKNINDEGTQSDSTKYNIYFGVHDTGIGISEAAQKNLFNPFSQANSSIARKFGGSGLGLAISKGLIEKMGSAVNISSNEGEGSTFFFTLKMEKGLSASTQGSAPVTTAPATQKEERPLKILLVDDNDITRKVVAGFLQEGKHDIVHVKNAEDGLAKIYEDNFDLVFMDIELPGMRGNEAVKKLRLSKDAVKSKVPVFALTGNVDQESLSRYIADGMTGFVAKPIDQSKLKEIVSYVAAQNPVVEIIPPAEKTFFDNAAQTSAKQAALPLASASNIAPDTRVFNPEMLHSLKDTIGKSPLNDLLNDLIVKTDEILSDMAKAVDADDFTALASRAHELKGMAGNFGLVEVSSLAEQTEQKAKRNEKDGLKLLMIQLPDASLRAKDVLRQWVSH